MVATKGELEGFYAPNQKRLKERDRQNSKCDQCGKVCHTKVDLFEIVGYQKIGALKGRNVILEAMEGQPRAHHTHVSEVQKDEEENGAGACVTWFACDF